jgi:predicted transposase YdaD
MPAKTFDPTLKALVEYGPRDWLALVGGPRARATIIDADIATVSGAADKVIHVGGEPPYLLHLEFVSGHDSATLPGSLNVRNVLLEDRHGLPVRSVAVLLRPESDSPQLSGVRLRSFPGEEPYNVFRYDVIRVWQLPAERLLAGGFWTLPLAPISAVTEADLPGIIQRMEERVGRRARGRAPAFWAATFILMGLRYSSALAAQLLRRMVTMRESATYQAILEEGRAEGLARGQVIGAVGEARNFLRLQGEHRFGPPDARTVAALQAIADLPRLEELGVRLLSAASWHELLGLPAPRRRNGRRQGS